MSESDEITQAIFKCAVGGENIKEKTTLTVNPDGTQTKKIEKTVEKFAPNFRAIEMWQSINGKNRQTEIISKLAQLIEPPAEPAIIVKPKPERKQNDKHSKSNTSKKTSKSRTAN